MIFEIDLFINFCYNDMFYTKSRFDFLLGSGVARVPCALKHEIFLRPPSTKTAEFEVKNRRKSAKEAKSEHFLLLV